MTCMENKRRCRRSSLIAALFHAGLIRMNLWHFRRPQNSPTDFWASASSLCLMETNICWFWFCSCWTVSLARTASLSWEVEDVSLEYILLWKIIWKCQNTLLHSTLCFFSSKAFKWNCPAQLIIQKYSAGGKKKRQHMQPFFHSFLIKLTLRLTSMIGKRQKKLFLMSHWMEPKTFGWEVKMGYLCPLWHHTGLLGQTSVLF